MDKIFRVEHSIIVSEECEMINIGPYNSESFEGKDEMVGTHLNETHPGLRDDFVEYQRYQTKHIFCAFNSVELLKAWFNGFHEALHKANFIIVEYTVEKFINGQSGKQCFFDKKLIIEKKFHSFLVD